jgi:hypothetical protein
LFVVLFKCEMLYLTFRKHYKFHVFEKKEVIREIFVPKQYEITEHFRLCHNDEICYLYKPFMLCCEDNDFWENAMAKIVVRKWRQRMHISLRRRNLLVPVHL